MLKRIFSLALLVWLIGFLWFALALPQPGGADRTDAVVVLTGGEGRIARGLEALDRGWSKRLFVSGVDRHVKPIEFAVEYKVSARRMACCVTLGFEAYDTRTNATEVARWLARGKVRTVRLVTTDWHMHRAMYELRRLAPARVRFIVDAVPSQPSMRTLFIEYHKLLTRMASGVVGD